MEGTHFIDKEPNRYEALAELHRQTIQSMNEKQIINLIESFEKLWDLRSGDYRNARELGYRQFIHEDNWDDNGNPRPEKIDILAIKGIKEKQRRFLLDMKFHMAANNIGNTDIDGDGVTLIRRVYNILKQVKDGYDNIRRHYQSFERVVNPTALPQLSVTSDPSTMDDDEIESSTPFQKCLIYVLDEIYKAGYRRYKGQCCEEIKTIEGHRTRAWKPKFSIETFVYSLAQKDDDFKNWQNFTSRGTIFRDVIDHMLRCDDPQFPEIEKRRQVWSFKNGLFCGKIYDPESDSFLCRFYPYESKEFACLDPSLISCKYFDMQFDDFSHIEDWSDIPTPYFDQILHYQGFEREVCNWTYVMGGRLCFDVSELDTWQVMPFFKGIARSGKSTLITKVFNKFYEHEDVGTLSNNVEKKFGLSAIKDNFLFIAPEVKGDLALEQAEFQSIVSGENVSVAVKNKTAVSIEWTVPGVLGGNEVPNWKDNSGSVLRRILTWNFTKQVRDADPQLDKKLEKEMPIILLKCVRGYLDYVKKYGNRDIWKVVPQYFMNIQRQVAMVASTLHNFLASPNVKYGKDLYVPRSVFQAAFQAHCKSEDLRKGSGFHEDFYIGPFSAYDIDAKSASVVYMGKPYNNQTIFYGIDILEDNSLMTENRH